MSAPTITPTRVPPAPAPVQEHHPLGRLLFGALLILLGLAWMLDAAGVYELRWQRALSKGAVR